MFALVITPTPCFGRRRCNGIKWKSEKAKFCSGIRKSLFVNDETPGILAISRCEKRMDLIDWIAKGIDFGQVPFGGMIKGLFHILYESLRTSMEGKLILINQMKTMENQMETMKLTLDKVAAVNLKQEEEVGESLEEVLSEKISTATMMHDPETRLKEDGEFQTINCHDTNPLVNEAFAVNNFMSEVGILLSSVF
ncbi:unnamed protein product [Mytilus edulis]|uniref:Uncharacterized protein n=1 Tax=Mytilus edulis TaxID=6550 RepID=A0A8S3TK47_MYTED|nr:unnamed protein product [Mytilus edulis]